MPYCRKCGAEVAEGVAFCQVCGASMNDAQGSANQSQYNPGAQNSPYQAAPNDVEDNKLIGILCYLGILLLIPLLTRPDSQFIKFHSNQGLLLLLLGIAAGVVAAIPVLGWIVAVAASIFSLVCFIMGIINVTSGQMKELPLIGKIQILK